MGEILRCHGGSVTGSSPHAKLLNQVASMFCLEHGIELGRNWTYWEKDNPKNSFQVKLISLKDWDEFKLFCRDLGIEIKLKHKMIDMNKIWWPSTIEVDTTDDNEYLVWIKLTEY